MRRTLQRIQSAARDAVVAFFLAPNPYPEVGDQRDQDRFAWFPVPLDAGGWVHLRWYIAREEFYYEPAPPISGWARVGARLAED